MEKTFSLVVIIINRGYSDDVMEIARENGATGGTIVHGKGSSSKEMAHFFNLTLHEEREIILIVATNELRDKLMLAIMKAAGLNTKAGGIVFTLPVEQFEILSKINQSNDEIEIDNSNK